MKVVAAVGWTALALAAFAANSLLCRGALQDAATDPVTFTLVRLGSGALVLGLLARGRGPASAGWLPAVCLFAYALGFSLAYVRLGAATGALLLFGSVQLAMFTASVRRGPRPRPRAWAGLLVAFGGLLVLTAPGLTAPDPLGGGWMALAGLAWGCYSLLGRRAGDPLAANAANFARCVPLAVIAFGVAALQGPVRLSLWGALLALASGAVASGLGYAVWFRALRLLSAPAASVAQLAVPPLAAAGAVLWLGEPFPARLLWASLLTLGGIALATAPARR